MQRSLKHWQLASSQGRFKCPNRATSEKEGDPKKERSPLFRWHLVFRPSRLSECAVMHDHGVNTFGFKGRVKGSSRTILSIHGSGFPGSEIGCFEPGNVFQDLETGKNPGLHRLRITCLMHRWIGVAGATRRAGAIADY